MNKIILFTLFVVLGIYIDINTFAAGSSIASSAMEAPSTIVFKPEHGSSLSMAFVKLILSGAMLLGMAYGFMILYRNKVGNKAAHSAPNKATILLTQRLSRRVHLTLTQLDDIQYVIIEGPTGIAIKQHNPADKNTQAG